METKENESQQKTKMEQLKKTNKKEKNENEKENGKQQKTKSEQLKKTNKKTHTKKTRTKKKMGSNRKRRVSN